MINIDGIHFPELVLLHLRNSVAHANKITREFLEKHLLSAFWRFSSLSIAIHLCRFPLPFHKNTKRERKLAIVWRRNHHFILGKPAKIGRTELIQRRFMLNSAMYHLQPQMMEMLSACAAELEHARLQVVERGDLPVFAPFHTLSDVMAGVVVAMTATKRTHVYSIYQDDYLGKEAAAKLVTHGLEILQHHPAESSAQQRVIFRELKAGKANVVIFPDALPECTLNFVGYAMPSRRAILFGRPARLHSGAEKIAKIAGGKLIPFYLFWNDEQARLCIRIFDPCEDGDMLAHCMEQALKECGDQWPLWHYASLFYFNDAGK